MQVPWQKLRDYREASGEEGGNDEPEEADDNGIGHDVRDEPKEDLQEKPDDNVDEHHGPLAYLASDVGEEEASKCEAAPEAGGDITDLARDAVADRDEELDNPA